MQALPGPMTDSQAVQPADWEMYIAEVAADILGEQSPRRLYQVWYRKCGRGAVPGAIQEVCGGGGSTRCGTGSVGGGAVQGWGLGCVGGSSYRAESGRLRHTLYCNPLHCYVMHCRSAASCTSCWPTASRPS